jgi:hypothetical protein
MHTIIKTQTVKAITYFKDIASLLDIKVFSNIQKLLDILENKRLHERNWFVVLR